MTKSNGNYWKMLEELNIRWNLNINFKHSAPVTLVHFKPILCKVCIQVYWYIS